MIGRSWRELQTNSLFTAPSHHPAAGPHAPSWDRRPKREHFPPLSTGPHAFGGGYQLHGTQVPVTDATERDRHHLSTHFLRHMG